MRLRTIAFVLISPFLVLGGCVGDDPVVGDAGETDASTLDGPNTDSAPPADGSASDSGLDAPADTDSVDSGLDAGPPDATGAVAWIVAARAALLGIATSVAYDDAGNVIVGGYYSSSTWAVDLGNGKTLPTTLAGGSMAYVAKFNGNGLCLWAVPITTDVQPGGLGAVYVAAAPGGDVVLAMAAKGNVAIGGGATKATNGSLDIVVARLDQSGAQKWFDVYGGPLDDNVSGVAVDGAGRTAVSGNFYPQASGSVHFDSVSYTFTTGSHTVGFVALLGASGVTQWMKPFPNITPDGGTGAYAGATSVAFDPSTNVIVGGSFNGVVEMHATATGMDMSGNQALTASGSPNDGWVAKLDGTNGKLAWANQIGGPGIDEVKAVAVDPVQGNVVAAFIYTGAITVGPGAAARTLGAFGGLDVAFARFEPSGALADVHEFGSAGTDMPDSVAVDRWGEILLGGEQAGTISFGGKNATGQGGTDGFLAKFSASATPLWAFGVGGGSGDGIFGVAVDPAGRIAFSGMLTGNGVVAGTILTTDASTGSAALVGVLAP